MGQIDSKQLAREIQKAFDESLSISSGSARQLIVSDTKPAASQLPVIDQLEAVKYIQNYLEGVYSRIEGSEFKLILSLRRILAANDVDSSETLKREAEHTGRLVHSMLHGLNRLKEKIEDPKLSYNILDLQVHLNYLLEFVLLPMTKPNDLSLPHSDPRGFTERVIAGLQGKPDVEKLLLTVDPGFLNRVEDITPYIPEKNFHLPIKKRSSATKPKQSAEKKNQERGSDVPIERDAHDGLARYEGRIHTHNNRLARELYVSKISSFDEQGTEIATIPRHFPIHSRKLDPHEYPEENSAVITLPVWLLERTVDGSFILPCPRGAIVEGTNLDGVLARSNYNTYSFYPKESAGEITYLVTIDPVNSKSEFEKVEKLPLDQFCRTETFTADEIVSGIEDPKRRASFIVSAAGSLGGIYSADSWADEIYRASGERAHLAMEALQVFKCDTSSRYLGHRLRQHGINCHLVSGFVASQSERALGVSAGHQEIEFSVDDTVYRLSSGSHTSSSGRIESKSPVLAGLDALLVKIPSMSDEALFEALIDFRSKLPVSDNDREQFERERNLFGEGASSFDRPPVDEMTTDQYAFTLSLISESLPFAITGELHAPEVRTLLNRITEAYKFDRSHSSLDSPLEKYFGDQGIPPEFASMSGWDSEKRDYRISTMCRELLANLILLQDPEIEKIVLDFLRPSLLPDQYSDRSRFMTFQLYQALEISGVERLQHFDVTQRANICYSLFNDVGRYNITIDRKYEDLLKNLGHIIYDLAKDVLNDPSLPSNNYWSRWLYSNHNDSSPLSNLSFYCAYRAQDSDLDERLKAYCMLINASIEPAEFFASEIAHASDPEFIPLFCKIVGEKNLLPELITPEGTITPAVEQYLAEAYSRKFNYLTSRIPPRLPVTVASLNTLDAIGFPIERLAYLCGDFLAHQPYETGEGVLAVLALPSDATFSDRHRAASSHIPTPIPHTVLALSKIFKVLPDGQKIAEDALNRSRGGEINDFKLLEKPNSFLYEKIIHYIPGSFPTKESLTVVRTALTAEAKRYKSFRIPTSMFPDSSLDQGLLSELESQEGAFVSSLLEALTGQFNPRRMEAKTIQLSSDWNTVLPFIAARDRYKFNAPIAEVMIAGMAEGMQKGRALLSKVEGSYVANHSLKKNTEPGLEFEELRQAQPGDPIRHINWKASARHGELIANVYREAEPSTVKLDVELAPLIEAIHEGHEEQKLVFVKELSRTVGALKHQREVEVNYNLKGHTIGTSRIPNNWMSNYKELLEHIQDVMLIVDQLTRYEETLYSVGTDLYDSPLLKKNYLNNLKSTPLQTTETELDASIPTSPRTS